MQEEHDSGGLSDIAYIDRQTCQCPKYSPLRCAARVLRQVLTIMASLSSNSITNKVQGCALIVDRAGFSCSSGLLLYGMLVARQVLTNVILVCNWYLVDNDSNIVLCIPLIVMITLLRKVAVQDSD